MEDQSKREVEEANSLYDEDSEKSDPEPEDAHNHFTPARELSGDWENTTDNDTGENMKARGRYKRKQWGHIGANADPDLRDEPEWQDLRGDMGVKKWGSGGKPRGRSQTEADRWIRDHETEHRLSKAPTVPEARQIIARWLGDRRYADVARTLPDHLGVDRRVKSVKKLKHAQLRLLAAWILEQEPKAPPEPVNTGKRKISLWEAFNAWRFGRRWWERIAGGQGYPKTAELWYNERWPNRPKTETKDGRSYTVQPPRRD